MRLFPFGSHVQDIYNGSLESLGRVLRQSELRFVAYYAPWCAQSRKMVPEMGLAADLLKETVSIDWNFQAFSLYLLCTSDSYLPQHEKAHLDIYFG